MGNPGDELLKNGEIKLTLPAKVDVFPLLQEWMQSIADSLGVPQKTLRRIFVAIDEIFTNIASYAYPDGNGSLDVIASWNAEKSVLTLVFSDKGIPFNPLAQQDPDVTIPLAERSLGGLGIFVVKQLMDKIEYQRHDHRNFLTMAKKFDIEETP